MKTNTEQDDPPPPPTPPPPEKCRVSVFVDVGNLPVLPSVNVSIPAMRAALSGQERDGEQKDGGRELGGGQRSMEEGPVCGAVDLGWGATLYRGVCL